MPIVDAEASSPNPWSIYLVREFDLILKCTTISPHAPGPHYDPIHSLTLTLIWRWSNEPYSLPHPPLPLHSSAILSIPLHPFPLSPPFASSSWSFPSFLLLSTLFSSWIIIEATESIDFNQINLKPILALQGLSKDATGDVGPGPRKDWYKGQSFVTEAVCAWQRADPDEGETMCIEQRSKATLDLGLWQDLWHQTYRLWPCLDGTIDPLSVEKKGLDLPILWTCDSYLLGFRAKKRAADGAFYGISAIDKT